MYCSHVFNNTLRGDWFSNDFRYVSLKLKLCKGSHCAGENDMWNFFKNNPVEVFYKNQFTNTSGSEFLSTHTVRNTYVPLDKSVSKNNLFHIKKGFEKSYNLEANPIYAMGQVRFHTTNPDNETIYTLTLELDNQQLYIHTNHYSLSTFIAEISGYWNFFYVIFYFLTMFISRGIFMNKVLG